MAYETVPPGTRRQDVTIEKQIARRDVWCRCGRCSERILSGGDVSLVRWGSGRDEWGLLKPEHVTLVLGAIPQEEAEQDMLSIWWEKLPDGDRHEGKRFVVKIDEQAVYFTGQLQRAIGAAEFGASYLGLENESDVLS